VQDALVMNLDDMACAGAYSGFVVASNIARNKFRIPGEVVQTLIQHTQAYLELLSNWGVDAQLAGGETADVGDVVRTVDVGFTLACTLPRAHVLEVNPKPGDVIVGLSSAGQAVYESEYNSGIGCNGLTSARHDLFSHLYYSRYPETVSPETPETVAYQGKYLVTDTIDIQGASFTLGKLALSPTRTFLPVLSKLIPELRGQLHGIVHNTGGGQTKVLHFAESVHIIKDQLLQVPPIFWEIQRAMDTPWYEMFRTFNMGQRLEIYLPPNFAQTAIAIAAEFGIEAQVVGRVEASPNKRLSIDWQGHHLEYQ
jgi:phosphoribosylformylglycinamidine cyclo-ligase